MKTYVYFLVLVLLLSACGANPTRVPTRSRTPPFPTATPKTKPTATPVTVSACVTNSTIRIRSGPGTEYDAIGGLVSGTCITIIGKNGTGDWVNILTKDNITGWVYASLLTIDGNLYAVPFRSTSFTPASAQLTDFAPIITWTPFPNPYARATITPAFSSISLCSNSASFLDTYVTCKVERVYCDYVSDVNTTFCNDRPYPDHIFQLVFFDEDWSFLDGSCLIVSGFLETYYNDFQQTAYLQIIGRNSSQISYC